MKLISPINIAGLKFKNRVIMAPMRLGIRLTSSQARDFYVERARGGVGAIIVGATSVDLLSTDDALGQPGSVEAFVDGIYPLVDNVREADTRIGLQLWHGSRFPAGTGRPEDTRGELVAPSASGGIRELTRSEIELIISRFAQAAVNAQRAGFDFVEVNGAHGYLPCQFFSPISNQRDDEYGGDLTHRMRFGIQCVSAMRRAVGSVYPIFWRLGAWDEIPEGITLNDSARFAAELVKNGVDVIDISVGGMLGPDGSYAIPALIAMPGPERPEGTFVPQAEFIKKHVNVPVIAVGRFRTPEVMEDILAEGKADMLAIGRQLIAEPYWLAKVAAVRGEDIRPCISCNSCFETRYADSGYRCSVNAFACREAEGVITATYRPKKVMVVGSGPAGMEAACVAALRGHNVTIYEGQSELGGQLIPAALPPHKQELALLRRYLIRQIEKNPVHFKPGIEVTPQLIEKEKPDTVILATGSTPRIPQIPGIDQNNVVTAVDVILSRVEVGEKAVVIGGELVGCETADFLSEQGKKVTVVRRGPEMASNISAINRRALLDRLREKGVTLITGVKKYKAITKNSLVMIDSKGQQTIVEADTIILATGAIPNSQLAKALKDKVSKIYLAGDCAEPRRIGDAIHDGARVGLSV